MAVYRRNRVPGGTFFFTVNLLDRQASLLTAHIDALREAVRTARILRPFHIDAWAVLPDHMHCIWTLPKGDSDYSSRWQAIKIAFSKSLPRLSDTGRDTFRPRERGIWQRRYWEHTIRDGRDYAEHMDYIHFNPVKHGYACKAGDWPYSTFRRCVEAGFYPADWAGNEDGPVETGERR